ncbi:MAG: hypothetical protein ACJ8C4_11350 [Gemmataceae bacterium]
MRRWYLQLLGAAGLAVLPSGLLAQSPPQRQLPPNPPPPPVPTRISGDPEAFRAASPYNPTFIGRPLPSPIYNLPNFVLCCEWPNQSFEPFVAPNWRDGWGDRCGDYNSCGGIFRRNNFGCGGCDSGCGGCHSGCGCTGNAPAAPPPPPTRAPVQMKQVQALEPVGYWFHKEKDPAPVPACEACPVHGPAPAHHLPTGANLGCTNCSSWESEAVFVFGSCKQFFGQPTHDWLHRGR